MSKFLRLSSTIINKSHIAQIIIKPEKYLIYITNATYEGVLILGNGGLTTQHNIFEICKHKNIADFNTMTSFIHNI